MVMGEELWILSTSSMKSAMATMQDGWLISGASIRAGGRWVGWEVRPRRELRRNCHCSGSEPSPAPVGAGSEGRAGEAWSAEGADGAGGGMEEGWLVVLDRRGPVAGAQYGPSPSPR